MLQVPRSLVVGVRMKKSIKAISADRIFISLTSDHALIMLQAQAWCPFGDSEELEP